MSRPAPRETLIVVLLFVSLVLWLNAKSEAHDAVKLNHSLLSRLRHDEDSQLLNRAYNVESWCEGINGGRDYNREFVRRVTHGQVAYTLGDLPCETLIVKTLESPRRHEPLTAETHPLVWRARQRISTR